MTLTADPSFDGAASSSASTEDSVELSQSSTVRAEPALPIDKQRLQVILERIKVGFYTEPSVVERIAEEVWASLNGELPDFGD